VLSDGVVMQVSVVGFSVKNYNEPKKAFEILKDINFQDSKRVIGIKLNNIVKELYTVIDSDCTLEFITFDDPDGEKMYRHTCSHILAQAVSNIFPTVKLAIGPSIENGFYYDFDFVTSISRDDFDRIEQEMKRIIKANFPIERLEYSKTEAEEILLKKNQTYKLELLSDIPEGEKITFYRQGDFQDLCIGAHLTHTGKVKAHK